MVLSNALLMSIERIGSVSSSNRGQRYSYSRPQPFSGEMLWPPNDECHDAVNCIVSGKVFNCSNLRGHAVKFHKVTPSLWVMRFAVNCRPTLHTFASLLSFIAALTKRRPFHCASEGREGAVIVTNNLMRHHQWLSWAAGSGSSWCVGEGVAGPRDYFQVRCSRYEDS